ncbi:Ger(x)C family spore germination protein [Paenibacillus caui]|uniref:Ger(x)C family spore germination protein n=1 Tax=Paenibacillus caui TaxID=2873927 RepID=UPI001CA81ECB|nr:Ger(x)C family spore germination protein [Paenibacillus caui]
MKHRLILMLLIICLCLQSGCGNKIELNKLGIVSAMAFDLDESNQWIVTFQIIIPQASQGQSGTASSQSPVSVFSSQGKTVLQAIQNQELETPRRLFFSHNRAVIISRRVAEYGVDSILDFFLRNIETRENVDILLSDGEAKNVLEVLTPMETLPGNAIANLINEKRDGMSNWVPSKIHDLIVTLAKPAAGAALPEIKISGNKEETKSLDAFKETRSPAVLKIDRFGVFKQGKFAAWLSRKESAGIPWLTDRLNSTTVVFSCEGKRPKDKDSSFSVESSRTRIMPKFSDGRLSMSVDVDAKGILFETPCELDLKKPAILRQLEKQIQEQIKNDMERSFQAVKKVKADILGFGDAFHKAYPREWKTWSENWDNEFAKIQLDINVKVTIRRTGMINDSFSKMSGKNK